jgi:hypothetical protein
MTPGDDEQQDGQVSEVQSFGDAEEPIVDDQSVAGSPDPDVDEGPTGPNSRAGSGKN